MSATMSLPCPELPHASEPPPTPTASALGRPVGIDEVEGWQALAVATHGRLLTGPELTAAELLPVAVALDLLFPALGDAARHEALWALDATPD